MILKGILAIAILIIIPLLLGFFIINFFKEEKPNIFLAFVLGYILEFAICQIITVPMIFAEYSFTTLLYMYLIIVCILSIFSIIVNRKKIKEIIEDNVKSIKCFPKGLTILTIFLIGLQIYAFVGYAHIDDDDAFYVATSTVTVQTNTLYKYSPATGDIEKGDHLSARYRLAPFPILIAIISQIISVHPAIVSHVVIPIIFLPIVYIIYGLIAEELFKGNKRNVFMFLMVMSILHIWGNYSIRNNFTFLLFRIWQGKSVLVNMIIPAVILFFIKAEKQDYKLIYCLLLLMTIIAGNLTTTMGIGIPPMVLMLLCFVYEIFKIINKDIIGSKYRIFFKNIFKCLACCIPCIIYGIIYFVY